MRKALRRYETALAEEKSRIAAIRAAIREGREDIARGDYTVVETANDEAKLYADLTDGRPAKRHVHAA